MKSLPWVADYVWPNQTTRVFRPNKMSHRLCLDRKAKFGGNFHIWNAFITVLTFEYSVCESPPLQ